MKVPKSLLQAVAAALAVTVVTACAVENVDPEKGRQKKSKEEPYNCPGCGLG